MCELGQVPGQVGDHELPNTENTGLSSWIDHEMFTADSLLSMISMAL